MNGKKRPSIELTSDGYDSCPYCLERIVIGAKKCRHCSSQLTFGAKASLAIAPILHMSSLIAVLLALIAVRQTSRSLDIMTEEHEIMKVQTIVAPSPLLPSVVWVTDWDGESASGELTILPVVRLPLLARGQVPIDSILADSAHLLLWGDTLRSVATLAPFARKSEVTLDLAPYRSPPTPVVPGDSTTIEYKIRFTEYIENTMYMNEGIGVAMFSYWVYWRGQVKPQLESGVFLVSFKSNNPPWLRGDSLTFSNFLASEYVRKQLKIRSE